MKYRSSLALIGVRPDAGQRPSEYLMALTRRLVESMVIAAADESVPRI
jgi:hypothetical protein